MIWLGKDASTPAYAVGQCVRHRRYGYRGVVAALDRSFEGDEAWYRNNLTQPDRHQAWYHVLVHEAGHTTYAAESSLAPDESPEPVDHPLVQRYFKEFRGGRHVPRDS